MWSGVGRAISLIYELIYSKPMISDCHGVRRFHCRPGYGHVRERYLRGAKHLILVDQICLVEPRWRENVHQHAGSCCDLWRASSHASEMLEEPVADQVTRLRTKGSKPCYGLQSISRWIPEKWLLIASSSSPGNILTRINPGPCYPHICRWSWSSTFQWFLRASNQAAGRQGPAYHALSPVSALQNPAADWREPNPR